MFSSIFLFRVGDGDAGGDDARQFLATLQGPSRSSSVIAGLILRLSMRYYFPAGEYPTQVGLDALIGCALPSFLRFTLLWPYRSGLLVFRSIILNEVQRVRLVRSMLLAICAHLECYMIRDKNFSLHILFRVKRVFARYAVM